MTELVNQRANSIPLFRTTGLSSIWEEHCENHLMKLDDISFGVLSSLYIVV